MIPKAVGYSFAVILLMQFVLHVWLNVKIENVSQKFIKYEREINFNSKLIKISNELESRYIAKKSMIVAAEKEDSIKLATKKILNRKTISSKAVPPDPVIINPDVVIYNGRSSDEDCFTLDHCLANLDLSINFTIKTQSIKSAVFQFSYLTKSTNKQKQIIFKAQAGSLNKDEVYLEFAQSNKEPGERDNLNPGLTSPWRKVKFTGQLKGNCIFGKLTWSELADDMLSYKYLTYPIILYK